MRRLVWLCAVGLWAADPAEVVRRVAVYEYGKDPSAVRELETLVHQQGASMEKVLLAGLDSARTLAAKDALCRMLAIVGTRASAPKLEAMSRDPQTADMARYALAQISGPPARPPRRVIIGETLAAIPLMEGATERREVQILAGSSDRAVLREWALKGSVEVRPVALAGLARTGTPEDLPLLADRAANATGDEQAAARSALGSLRHGDFDAAILQAIPAAEPKIKVELIRAIGERGIVSAQEVLLAAAGDSNRPVRVASIRALRETAGEGEVPALVALLVKTANEAERREVERTAANAIRRSREAPVDAVLAAYQSSMDAGVRASLLNVMSSAGNSAALPTVRRALDEADQDLRRAALDALSNWPTPEPMDDLFALTKSGDEARRILALRGYIKLVQVPSNRTPPETARLLTTAFAAATRADEKRAVLSIAQRLVCRESLDLARQAVKDTEVAAEAQLAASTLERALIFLKQ